MGAAVGPAEQSVVDESAVLESLPTAMLVIDADGVIVRANRRAREILDRPALVGTPAGEILGPWPMPRTGDVARSERTLPRRDGTAITLGFSMSSLPDGTTTIASSPTADACCVQPRWAILWQKRRNAPTR